MIPKVNLGVGEMGFMFYDLKVDINSTNLLCLTSVLPGDTSDSRNSSLKIFLVYIRTKNIGWG